MESVINKGVEVLDKGMVVLDSAEGALVVYMLGWGKIGNDIVEIAVRVKKIIKMVDKILGDGF